MTTLQEFIAGTVPTNAASALRTQLRQTAQGVFLDWNVHPGFTYQVQTTTNVTASWANLGTPRFAAGTNDTLFVTGGASAFYRVELLR
jgi:hypothetical protein